MFKSFQFNVNDTVYMEWDPVAKKIRFKKNDGPEQFDIDFEFQAGDEMYPCVNLCSTNDQVEVVNNVKVVFSEQSSWELEYSRVVLYYIAKRNFKLFVTREFYYQLL